MDGKGLKLKLRFLTAIESTYFRCSAIYHKILQRISAKILHFDQPTCFEKFVGQLFTRDHYTSSFYRISSSKRRKMGHVKTSLHVFGEVVFQCNCYDLKATTVHFGSNTMLLRQQRDEKYRQQCGIAERRRDDAVTTATVANGNHVVVVGVAKCNGLLRVTTTSVRR